MKPTFYLFAFSPQTGEVHLTHEHESHPARSKNHQDLAHEVGETGLVHGYAYRIHGGWRLMDIDHDPFSDRFMARRIVEALKEREGPQPAAPCEDCDEPKTSNFRRFHYGLPCNRGLGYYKGQS